ncbi:MAG: phospholipid carrier-dependent glycosyltransferase [Chroococcidiopsidaceae cyanobacterium CP_BM_ER_R8_30]|nr:phospholipid carrier-dependent glycosyltransferase [Chroococcidiopsidaceae cyanobacterium CP_BM_ER_R8_30]
MSGFKKLNSQPLPWFTIGLAGVFLFCLALRFWGLGRFNTLVFDEVYYAKFANNYLTHTRFFDGHPPLSKYLIAIGMWIGDRLPFGRDAMNSLAGSVHSTWSYRWLNALTGSFIPLVMAGIAYQLSYRKSYALIAALLAATDGIFLVDSRYALNNVYLVIFGLLGQWFLLRALERRGLGRRFWSALAAILQRGLLRRRVRRGFWLTLAVILRRGLLRWWRGRGLWLTLAGIGFGAAASVKWNGLGFLLGAYLIWLTAWALRLVRYFQSRATAANPEVIQRKTALGYLTQLNAWHVLFYLAIIPAFFYWVEWIPHLQLNPRFDFWEVQSQILAYHERVGDGPKVHPYCSHWYTWPLMLRPVAFFYATTQRLTDPLPVMGPPLPGIDGKVVYDVHDIGNPFLWWFSTVAILWLLWMLTHQFWIWVFALRFDVSTIRVSWQPFQIQIALYLVLNWIANLLPWVKVTRCTFLYHYMESYVFAVLAFAWLVDHWLSSYRRDIRALGVTLVFIILLAFIYWMPIYLGLPLTPEGYHARLPRFDIYLLPPWLSQRIPSWVNEWLINWI